MIRSVCLLLVWLAIFPCHATEGPPIPVVASFSILGDMVENIGGKHVAVTVLVGPDADAHVYEPTPDDVRSIRNCSLLVVNGLEFEGWMDRLVEASGYKGPVVVATKGIAPYRPGGGQSAAVDPHAWQSLKNAEKYVRNIEKALSGTAPERAGHFREALGTYVTALGSLDSLVRMELSAIPVNRRKVITSHDAFGYFARDYGVEFLAPQGWSTEDQPTAAKVARLIVQARKSRIRALFVENISDPRLLEQVARETGASLGGKLFSDALSGPGGPADTYLKMFRHNTSLLKAALAQEAETGKRD